MLLARECRVKMSGFIDPSVQTISSDRSPLPTPSQRSPGLQPQLRAGSKETGLDERGMAVKGRGDTPNYHDMLTGTQQDGTAVPGSDDATCSNWTSGADGQGSAVVGHHDLIGNTQGPNFWNYSHKTPGCSQANLQRVGGGGLFYCFAVN